MSSIAAIARDTQAIVDPRQLPGLAAWFDARSPLGLGVAPPADGTPLAQWSDLSGKGNHITNVTGSQQPTWMSTNRNLMPLPIATVVSGWSPRAPSNTLVYEAGGITTFTNGKVTATNTTDQLGAVTATWPYPALPNQAYYGNMRVRNNSTVSRSVTAYIEFFDSSGAYINSQGIGVNSQQIAPGTAFVFNGRITGNLSPANAAFHNVLVLVNGTNAVGDSVQWDQVSVSTTPIPGYVPPVALPGGMPVASFNGVNYLASAGTLWFPGITGITLYMVLSYAQASSAWQSSFFHRGNFQGVNHYLEQGTSKMQAWSGVNNATAWDIAASNVVPTWGTPMIVSSTHGAGIGLYRNGSQIASTAQSIVLTPLPAGSPLNVGSGTGGGSASSSAISAVLYFTTQHDTLTRRRIEQYLSRAYGIPVV